MSWATCAECGETFGSDSAFDLHRITTTGQPGYDAEYDWRCAVPTEIEAKGLHRDERGWWRFGGVRTDARTPILPAGSEPGLISGAET